MFGVLVNLVNGGAPYGDTPFDFVVFDFWTSVFRVWER